MAVTTVMPVLHRLDVERLLGTDLAGDPSAVVPARSPRTQSPPPRGGGRGWEKLWGADPG